MPLRHPLGGWQRFALMAKPGGATSYAVWTRGSYALIYADPGPRAWTQFERIIYLVDYQTNLPAFSAEHGLTTYQPEIEQEGIWSDAESAYERALSQLMVQLQLK